jgi:hypothetical protein
MALHRRLGADVRRQYHIVGLLAPRSSFGTLGTIAPTGWSGLTPFMPGRFDAEPPKRQSHERGLYP